MRRSENQMNKVNSEHIMESLLSEYLDDSTPQEINVDELRTRAIDPKTAIRFDAAFKAANKGWASSTSSQTVITAHHPRRVKLRTPSFWTKSFYLLSGVAAGVLLAFGSWSFLKLEKGEKGSGLINSQMKLANSELDHKVKQPNAADNKIAAETSPASGSSELLSMDSVPFPTNTSKGSIKTDRSNVSDKSKKPSISGSSIVLNSDQLVALVDDQMEYMWKLRGVNPTTAIADEQWLQRASLLVLGKPVSSEDQANFLSDTSITRRQNWLDSATQSDDFYQHWSNKFANAILPKSESTESSDSLADRTRFKTWLQNRLKASIPLNEIVNEILVAQGSLVANASDYSPQAYWWAQVAANDDHSRATNAITSNLLGQRGSCIRCHDSNASSKQLLSNSLSSNDASNQPSVSRDDYWNLASVVSGISVLGKKVASSNKSNEAQSAASTQEQKSTNRTVGYAEDWHTLFYERLDRSLIAAKTKLPNGVDLTAPSEKRPTSKDAIRKNIEQLASWITSTPTFDQRQVNWVWESMLGQPLQNRYLIVESEGLVEKQELLEALGNQLRGSQFNLAKLVKAIALTNIFQLESQSCDPVWYITSTPQELADYQQRQHLFASFPATMDPSFRSLKHVATWFRKSHSSVLGQPSFDPTKLPKLKDGRKPESVAPEVTPAQTEFIVRSRVLPKGLVTEVEHWLKSSMPWEELVDHAFYLADDAPATKLEQMSARELLNSTRDRRQAIQRILASQLP